LDKDIPIAKKIVKTKIIILTKFKGERLKANMIADNTISTMYIKSVWTVRAKINVTVYMF
jgi:hypothetical protein